MSNELQHTPGPWYVQHWDNYPDRVVISDDTNTRALAIVDKADEQDKANARLIAAAPETAAERDRLKEVNAELLEALELCLDREDISDDELGDVIRATIKKSKGV